MTTQQGEAQSQDAVVERPLAGQGVPGQDPQAAAEAEGHQPGAEQEQAVKKPAPRTYSQAEWSARESAKDKESAELRRQLRDRDIRESQSRAVATESQARAADARAVEDGEITTAEAADRAQRRVGYVNEERQRQRERAAHKAMMDDAERIGRILAATDYAQEFGVAIDDLLKDESLTDSVKMREKAWQMYKAKTEANTKGTEKFDSAQVTTSKGSKSYLDRLTSGDVLPSAAEIDRLTAKYLK